jgi:acyl carrier protein
MSGDAKQKIRGFIAGLLEGHAGNTDFSDSESLFQSGRLDSMSAVELVTFLEMEFGVDFANVDFDIAMFDSVDLIEGFVAPMPRPAAGGMSARR